MTANLHSCYVKVSESENLEAKSRNWRPTFYLRLRNRDYNQLWYCCNLSISVALNVRFTMNGMCAKNTTHIRASNKRVIPIEQWFSTAGLATRGWKPLLYRDLTACEPGEQLIVLVNGDDESDLGGDLYCCLLPQCEASHTCRSGFPIATIWLKYFQ